MTINVLIFFLKKVISSVDNFFTDISGSQMGNNFFTQLFLRGRGRSLYRHAQVVFLPLSTLKGTANAPAVDPFSRLYTLRGSRSGF